MIIITKSSINLLLFMDYCVKLSSIRKYVIIKERKMTVYIVLLAFCLIGWIIDIKTMNSFKNKHTHTIIRYSLTILLAGAFIVIASYRYSIGFDYFSYEDIANSLINTDGTATILDIIETYYPEPSYYVLNWLFVNNVSTDYHLWLLCINTFMVLATFLVICQNTDNPWIGYALFVCLHFFAHDMNLIRQSLAATIVFCGYKYLKNGKFFRFLIITLIAASFHVSAIVAIPVFFIVRLPLNKITISVTSILALIIIFAAKPIILAIGPHTKYASYLSGNSIYMSPGSVKQMGLTILVMLIPLFFIKRLLSEDRRNKIVVWSTFACTIFCLMGMQMFIIERFASFFYITALVHLPQLLDLYTVKKSDLEIEAVKDASDAEGTMDYFAQKNKLKEKKEMYNMTAFIVLFAGIIVFSFGSIQGYHKAYPYISVNHKELAISNDEYVRLANPVSYYKYIKANNQE